MADKLDFGKLKKKPTSSQQKKEIQEKKVYQEVTIPPAKETKAKPPKKKGKVGRKSWKSSGVEYTRMGFDLPMEMQQKLKQLMATKFFGKFVAQDEMINQAISDFIKKHMKE